MKKTVIKRRKRVPAAPGVTTGRMSDQAAAEALVAVGRLGGGGGGGSGSEREKAEDGSDEGEQPKRKRARRGIKEKERRDRDRDDDDLGMDTGGDDEPSGSGVGPRKRSRDANEGSSGSWREGGQQQQQQKQPSSSPALEHQAARAHSIPRSQDGAGPDVNSRYAHLQRGSQYATGSPHPHGGFDLPPLAALSSGGNGGSGGGASGGGPGDAGRSFAGFSHFGGPSSSYMRSGSGAPSRTHSPMAGNGGGYVLPPPHGMSLPHGGGYAYHSSHEIGGDGGGNGVGMVAAVPSLGELEKHYSALQDYKQDLKEMIEKTERLIGGVKRGIDEMRGMQQQQQQLPPSSSSSQQQQHQQQGHPSASGSVALLRGPEREQRKRENVWPVDSAHRD